MRCLAPLCLFSALLWTCTTTAVAQKPRRVLSEEAKQQVEAALPAQCRPPLPRARKLLIYDGNVGYGGHGSIPYANHAFTRMGEKTGAFTTEVSDDPAVFQKEHLAQFDAVCLNNTVGNLFTDPVLRQNLLEFVLAGGGLLGIHGTTVAFTDFQQRGPGDVAGVRVHAGWTRSRPFGAGRTRFHQAR